MLNFENLGDRFTSVTQSEEWNELQEKFNNAEGIVTGKVK